MPFPTALLTTSAGIFLDSCQHHCGGAAGAWNGPQIDGFLSSTGLQAWYTKGSAGLANKGFFNQNQPFPCEGCCHGSK